MFDQFRERFNQDREIFISNQVELNKAIQAQQEQIAILNQTLQEMQHDIPDEDRKKSKARLANAISQASINAKNQKTASLHDYRLQMMQEPQVEVVWEGDPFTFSIRNVEFPIRYGRQVVPKSVAETLTERKKRIAEGQARKDITRIGRRRDGRRILPYGEVSRWSREIDRKFRGGESTKVESINVESFLLDHARSR
jgi:hypothetical protein